MSDPLKHVQPGSRERPAAAAWNILVDQARERQRQGRRTGAGTPPHPVHPTVTCLVRNDSGSARVAGNVLAITGVEVAPDDHPADVRLRPVFTGGVPAAATDAFAILLKSVPDGGVGLALVEGVAVVSVDVEDEAHGYARPGASAGHLVSAPGGTAQILYKPAGTGVLTGCVVLVGASDPMDGEVSFDVPVAFEQDPDSEECRMIPTAWETYTISGLPTGVSVDNGDGGGGFFTGTVP